MRQSFVVALAVLLASGASALAQPDRPNACGAGSGSIGDAYYPWMGNAGYDADHYTLDLDLDVAGGAIRSGLAQIQATALTDLCAFNLDFNGLEIDDVAVDGAPATWRRDGQELTISPRQPLPRGVAFLVEVRYHGRPEGLETLSIDETLALQDEEAAAAPVGAGGPDSGEGDAGATLVASTDATPAAAEPPSSPFGELTSPDSDRYGPSIGGWWTTGSSLWVLGEPRGAEFWYPVNGHPADRATYTLRLTVDEPFEVFANGPLIERTDLGDQVVSTFAPRFPMASYLVTINAGAFDVVEVQTDGGLPVRLVFAADTPPDQREMMVRAIPEMIAFYEERFGPYPFELAGAVVSDADFAYALESQTMPTFGANLPAPDAAPEERAEALARAELTVAHETAHQWFGNAVAPLRWRDIFLSEGLTQYATYLWQEERDGRSAMERSLQRSHEVIAAFVVLADPSGLSGAEAFEVLARRTLSEASQARLLGHFGAESPDDLADRSGVDVVAVAIDLFDMRPTDWLVTPVETGDPGPWANFSYDFVYQRGALTMHALRLELGDDPFFALLREWAATYGGSNATIEDFIATAERVSGRDLGAFFDAWLFSTSVPPLDFPAAES